MTDVPIRSLTISDFRRLKGTRVLPFDAPIVLIHGSNGTGKTSVLSALELGLTGSIRSMERQDDRYAAHLPFLGQSYAAVRVDVADSLHTGTIGMPLTVKNGHIDGTPVFSEEMAKFYSERCYLDQASLGRLLELYQHREGKDGESALARFVNELLGLEKLDALRTGLHEATDLRLLKKLATGADEAASKAKEAASQLTEYEAALGEAGIERSAARSATIEAIEILHPGVTDGMNDTELLQFVRKVLADDSFSAEAVDAGRNHQDLIALGGRISALVERPSMQRIGDAQATLNRVTSHRKMWAANHSTVIQAWETAAQALGFKLRGDRPDAVRQATMRVHAELHSDEALRVQTNDVSAKLVTDRAELDRVQARLVAAHEHSSALVESLIALRTVLQDNVCPVCDRDYTETGHLSLRDHIDKKLSELTAHGQQLLALRSERDKIAASIAHSQAEQEQLNARLLSGNELQDLGQRYTTLVKLVAQLDALEPVIAAGKDLDEQERAARETLENLKAASSEEQQIRKELAQYVDLFGLKISDFDDTPHNTWRQLAGRAAAEVERLNKAIEGYRAAKTASARLSVALEHEAAAKQSATDIRANKLRWDASVAETKRRQAVAREVHDAATQARTTVVQRVFTESLNDVWSSVFTRLAPDEGFIPSFGIPTATKTALDIKLETTHRTGEAGGSPQMMLSAGNLNTAALSLFLALHLVVEPMAPCLVFDDPVQAMDEVHVAQFAGLIRILAKQHQRQVVIAVHERELFDYLALELSPAYEGDELITIELGEREDNEDENIIRHTWAPDLAIAG